MNVSGRLDRIDIAESKDSFKDLAICHKASLYGRTAYYWFSCVLSMRFEGLSPRSIARTLATISLPIRSIGVSTGDVHVFNYFSNRHVGADSLLWGRLLPPILVLPPPLSRVLVDEIQTPTPSVGHVRASCLYQEVSHDQTTMLAEIIPKSKNRKKNPPNARQLLLQVPTQVSLPSCSLLPPHA